MASNSPMGAETRSHVTSRPPWWALPYRAFAYFGLLSVFAALLFGFHYEPDASPLNYVWDVLIYAAFISPHLVMTRSWFKRAAMGNPAGSPAERRVYITISVVTWLAVFAFHLPVPGPAFELPSAVRFAGYVGFLLGLLLFFNGMTFAAIDGLLGIPGAVTSYAHGPEASLFTEGPYASVRHPMYRAVLLAGVSSLLVYAHLGQLFWVALLGASFIGFIPVEEAQLIAARGDDYRRYRQQTPWRLIRGIW